MKNKNFILLILLSWIGLYACKKDPPPIPPQIIDYSVLPLETQTGANTFGCLAYGKVWVPRVELLNPFYDKSALFSEKNNLGRGGFSCRIIDSGIDESMSFNFGPTYYKLGKCSVSANFQTNGSNWYSSDNSRDSLFNWVDITFIDTIENIISGTFQFSVYDEPGSIDKLTITEGRFDMHYSPQ
jgi:hypothetical protein